MRALGDLAHCIFVPTLADSCLLVAARGRRFPVLIAIDAIDALYEPVSQYPFLGEFLPPSRLSVLDAFRVLDSDGNLRPEQQLKRGTVLAAVSHHYTNIPSVLSSVSAASLQ